MTKQDAINIIKLLFTADNGCSVCVSELLCKFIEQYPEYKILAVQISEEDGWGELYDKPDWFLPIEEDPS